MERKRDGFVPAVDLAIDRWASRRPRAAISHHRRATTSHSSTDPNRPEHHDHAAGVVCLHIAWMLARPPRQTCLPVLVLFVS